MLGIECSRAARHDMADLFEITAPGRGDDEGDTRVPGSNDQIRCQKPCLRLELGKVTLGRVICQGFPSESAEYAGWR